MYLYFRSLVSILILSTVSSHEFHKIVDSRNLSPLKRMKNTYNWPKYIDDDSTHTFNYDGDTGPIFWNQLFSTCGGVNQSPININTSDVTNVTLKPLQLKRFDTTFDSAFVMNNGHTVMVLLDNDDLPMISGGPLGDSEYVFHQYHFHWGPTDELGSEFMLNGKRFPLEMHIVFFNQNYQTFEDALDYSDGLCVLGFFFEVTTNDNPAFDYLVTDSLRHVIFADSTKQLSYHPRLADIISKDMEHYYTLHGSLTTPPCSEVVTWIDFKQTVPISAKQLREFRIFENSVGQPIPFNFRPIQAKNDRVVLYNVRNACVTSSPSKEMILAILIVCNFFKIKFIDK